MMKQKYYNRIHYLVFVLCLTFIVFITFFIIALKNVDLNNFLNFYKSVHQNLNGSNSNVDNLLHMKNLPHNNFFVFLYVALALFILNICISLFYYFILSWKSKFLFKNKISLRNILVFGYSIQILIVITSIILFTIVQSEYDWFNLWIRSLHNKANILTNLPNGLSPNQKTAFENFYNSLTLNNNNNFVVNYSWINIFVVWLVMGLFSLIVIVLKTKTFIFTFNNLNKDHNNDLSMNLKNKNISLEKDLKYQYFWQRILSPERFNLYTIVLISLIIVFLPQIIYTFLLILPNTHLHKFIVYNFIYANLFKNSDFFSNATVANDFYNTIGANPTNNNLIVFSLPSFFLISLLFWFNIAFLFMFKVRTASQKYYLVFLGGVFIFEVIALTLFILSQVSLNSAINRWNDFTSSNKSSLNPYLFGSNSVPSFWLTGYLLYASWIISYSLILFFKFFIYIKLQNYQKTFKKIEKRNNKININ